MRCLVPLIGAVGLLVAIGGSHAMAQSSADSYFHEAAQQYVDGNDAAAQQAVAEGLRNAPSDPRLVALRKKLQEKKQRPDEKQQNNSTTTDEQSQERSDGSPESTSEGEDDSPQSSEQGEAQAGNQDQSGNPPGSDRSSQSGQQSGSGRETEPDDSSSESFSPSESTAEREDRRGDGAPTDTLSRKQAERLLQALEGKERQLLRELQTRSASRQGSVENDW